MADERDHRAAIDRMAERIHKHSKGQVPREQAREQARDIAKRHDRVIKREL